MVWRVATGPQAWGGQVTEEAGLRPRKDLRTPAGHRKVGLGNRRLRREGGQVRALEQAERPPAQRLCWEEGLMVRVGGSVRALKCL